MIALTPWLRPVTVEAQYYGSDFSFERQYGRYQFHDQERFVLDQKLSRVYRLSDSGAKDISRILDTWHLPQ